MSRLTITDENEQEVTLQFNEFIDVLNFLNLNKEYIEQWLENGIIIGWEN